MMSEIALFFQREKYTIWVYFMLLFALSLAPLFLEGETPLFQAFALIPVFRLVNLTMPVFIEMTLFWLPLIYGPFIPVFIYLGLQASADDQGSSPTNQSGVSASRGANESLNEEVDRIGDGLPWWLGGPRSGKLRQVFGRIRQSFARPNKNLSLLHSILYWITRGLLVVLLPLVAIAILGSLFALIVYSAEIQYRTLTPTPLVPSLNLYQLTVLSVIMIGFVGFVEELLFRGVLQKTLERRLGVFPGLLLASGIFGLMHSAYGAPMGIVFAGGIGLLLGIVYDITDSLGLVSIGHGMMNVFLFGIIPLTGISPIDLLQAAVAQELQRTGYGWTINILSSVELWMFVSSL